MKRLVILFAPLLAVPLGCATSPSGLVSPAPTDEVLLSSLTIWDEPDSTPDHVVLGAGDALGRAVFAYYVAYVETQRRFAAAEASATIDQ